MTLDDDTSKGLSTALSEESKQITDDDEDTDEPSGDYSEENDEASEEEEDDIESDQEIRHRQGKNKTPPGKRYYDIRLH